MNKKEGYKELIQEFERHGTHLNWIKRSLKPNKKLDKIEIFLSFRIVELNNIIKLLKEDKDISDKKYSEFVKELNNKTIF